MVNAVYELTSPKDLLVLLFLLPLHVLYMIYGVVAVPLFTILVTQLLNIRQKALLAQFNALCERSTLKRSKESKKESKTGEPSQLANLANLTRQYYLLNEQLNSLCADICAISVYWARPLTMNTVGFVAIQCYMAYIVFFKPGDTPLFATAFFSLDLAQVELVQFVLIGQCAKVATRSGRLEAANRRFFKAAFQANNNNNNNNNSTDLVENQQTKISKSAAFRTLLIKVFRIFKFRKQKKFVFC